MHERVKESMTRSLILHGLTSLHRPPDIFSLGSGKIQLLRKGQQSFQSEEFSKCDRSGWWESHHGLLDGRLRDGRGRLAKVMIFSKYFHPRNHTDTPGGTWYVANDLLASWGNKSYNIRIPIHDIFVAINFEGIWRPDVPSADCQPNSILLRSQTTTALRTSG